MLTLLVMVLAYRHQVVKLVLKVLHQTELKQVMVFTVQDLVLQVQHTAFMVQQVPQRVLQ